MSMQCSSYHHRYRARGIAPEAGFTLLYALIVIGVLLMVSTSIFSIMIKEVRISAFGKESQIAYYASETGAECALYWARNNTTFSEGTTVTCSGQDIIMTDQNGDGTAELIIPVASGEACAWVNVFQPGLTIIQSRGYNICPPPVGSGPSSRRVERGLQIIF